MAYKIPAVNYGAPASGITNFGGANDQSNPFTALSAGAAPVANAANAVAGGNSSSGPTPPANGSLGFSDLGSKPASPEGMGHYGNDPNLPLIPDPWASTVAGLSDTPDFFGRTAQSWEDFQSANPITPDLPLLGQEYNYIAQTTSPDALSSILAGLTPQQAASETPIAHDNPAFVDYWSKLISPNIASAYNTPLGTGAGDELFSAIIGGGPGELLGAAGLEGGDPLWLEHATTDVARGWMGQYGGTGGGGPSGSVQH